MKPVRLSRIEPGAFVASVIAHLMLIASGAWLLAGRQRPAEIVVPVEVSIDVPPQPGGGNLTLGRSVAEPAPLPETDPEPPRAGGERAVRPDSGAPGRGGARDGERATNLSSSVDPLTLERDAPNHLERSEVQRLRVARVRRTLDDRRATPGPMELDFVASGRGSQNLRRPVARLDPSRGTADGGVSVRAGTTPGAEPTEDSFLLAGSSEPGGEPKRAQGADSQVGREYRRSAAIVTARPAVVRDRAAVPAQERDRPSDTVDSRQRVSARVAGLMQASTLGGDATSGVGGDPAPTAVMPAVGARSPGTGARSAPSGPGLGADLASDPGLQGFYRGVLAQLNAALDDAFPRWAIAQGRGGLVVFDLTLFEDGRVARVAVVRPSGIDEYDQNVLDGVRKIASFGRVPQEFGSRATLRINWDSVNPAVGRNGPGPGKRP